MLCLHSGKTSHQVGKALGLRRSGLAQPFTRMLACPHKKAAMRTVDDAVGHGHAPGALRQAARSAGAVARIDALPQQGAPKLALARHGAARRWQGL